MRPGKLFARLATLAVATLVCLVLAFLATPYLRRSSDEPFSGASVMASPRDLHVVTQPVRLSSVPDLTLARGMLYADGNAALGTQISRFVLDNPLFTLNVSGGAATETIANEAPQLPDAAGTLVEQLIGLGYDNLVIRRGSVQFVSRDGASETLSELEAELVNKRKGAISAKGSFQYRGHRLKFETTLTPPADRKTSQRWPFKVSLRSAFLDANFDGIADMARDVQLSGLADVAVPSLRRVARWFSIPVSNAAGMNAATLKGQFSWAGNALAFEQAKLSMDGNEGAGSVTLNMGGERPLIDGTLGFTAFDLAPYVDSLRPQTFGFERPSTGWGSLDLTVPFLRYIDADLRISTPKVTFKGFELGRTAATVSVRAGNLLLDVAEVELGSGGASLQLTTDTKEAIPRYALKGKIDNLDGAQAAAAFQFSQAWTGKGALHIDVAGVGQSPAEVLRSLNGKASVIASQGLRAPLDAKGLRTLAKASSVSGWSAISKGQTQFDQLEVRFAIVNGVAVAETVNARAGANAFTISGQVNLPDATLDVVVASRAMTPADKVLRSSDYIGADLVRLSGPLGQPTLQPIDLESLQPAPTPAIVVEDLAPSK
ncbi:MAG: hypothetical protein EKK41_14105 [Hyphomicrobiales bacterium]|nr:MAG: hypothetical protein EKK41_14105 [Hyphomicrobiales bacterium]